MKKKMKKSDFGRHMSRPNQYSNVKQSDQKNTSGQRRVRREQEKRGA